MEFRTELPEVLTGIGQHSAPNNSGSWPFALKTLTICLATFLSLFGSLGQYFFVDNYNAIIDARTNEMRSIQQRVAGLHEAHGLYFTAYTMSNLLFALLPEHDVPGADNNRQMFRLTLFDRGFPFRQMLAELSYSQVINFSEAKTHYDGLRDAAMKDFSSENYMALSNYEKEMVLKAGELQDKLQERYLDSEGEKAKAEAGRDQRVSMLLTLTALGTLLLLAANLMVERRVAGEKPKAH